MKTKQTTLLDYVDLTADQLNFSFSPAIVDDIIGGLMFRAEDELAAEDDFDADDINYDPNPAVLAAKIGRLKSNFMRLFTLDEDGEDVEYTAIIKNVMRFRLAVDHVSSGMSFRQAAAAIEHAKVRTKTAKLCGCNDHMIGQYVRVLVAVCLQKFSTILARPDVWAFSIAFDGSTHRGTSFFDVRLRVCVDGVLQNFHLVALPMFERYTSNNYVALIVKLLDALYVHWRFKLIGVSRDGENINTGRVQGVVTQLVAMAEFPVLRIWCVPHQLDLVVKAVTEALMDDTWVKIVYSTSVYLRAQANLVVEIGVTCPKKTNRWLHLGTVLDFLIKHEVRIIAYVQDKLDNPRRNGAIPPVMTDSDWVVTHVVAPAIERVNRTFTELQGRNLLICQQRGYVAELVIALVTMFGVKNTQTEMINDEMLDTEYCKSGDWWIEYKDIVEGIADSGRRAYERFNKLEDNADFTDPTSQAYTVREIAQFALDLITGVHDLQAERNNSNGPARDSAPHVKPGELAVCRPSRFRSEVQDPRRARLEKFWSAEDIELLEQQQQEIYKAYRDDPNFKKIVDSHDHTTGFNEAWDSISRVRFNVLRRFAGGLATVFANTTSVESDFSILYDQC
ncbi:unnamed protein product [Aphanomyces euteiches]|uniref:DUF659 domain-containing protein n=1 Tax=Aphanomyces euteiches TaxID=100861 RepID=A0A6G0WA87_9STRA|nr:hypothetical protein Ae201684_017134 [Aphanomyces euteiches]KAH9073987.1 hypothetical protein Ae201684P_015887 [Aphanomyces euteiches]KAH9152079.1 hypothetical protein AeRB84_005444 [Aphanomyces euteiches]